MVIFGGGHLSYGAYTLPRTRTLTPALTPTPTLTPTLTPTATLTLTRTPTPKLTRTLTPTLTQNPNPNPFIFPQNIFFSKQTKSTNNHIFS